MGIKGKIFVVYNIYSDNYESHIDGYFSTRQLAEKAIEEYAVKQVEYWNKHMRILYKNDEDFPEICLDKQHHIDKFTIEEYTLDEPL